jgi:hypothetical protein
VCANPPPGYGVIRWELYKLVRQRRTLFGLGATALLTGRRTVGGGNGAEAVCLGPQSGATFALYRPTSPFAQASRLARLAIIGFEAITRAALVPEDVGLVSEDHVAGDGVVGGRRPSEAADYQHPAREFGGS